MIAIPKIKLKIATCDQSTVYFYSVIRCMEIQSFLLAKGKDDNVITNTAQIYQCICDTKSTHSFFICNYMMMISVLLSAVVDTTHLVKLDNVRMTE